MLSTKNFHENKLAPSSSARNKKHPRKKLDAAKTMVSMKTCIEHRKYNIVERMRKMESVENYDFHI